MGSSVGSQFLYEYPAGMPARRASSSVALGGGWDAVLGRCCDDDCGRGGGLVGCCVPVKEARRGRGF
jgi:hypothetical protein